MRRISQYVLDIIARHQWLWPASLKWKYLALGLTAVAQVANAGAGRSYDMVLNSDKTGEAIYFTVHEPDTTSDTPKAPLLLHGAGFGLPRISSRSGAERYLNAGFGVISFDQRGFGESSAHVSVMDPDKDIANLIQVLDWAQANLNWLAYKDGKPRLGAVGGSYGGGYQLGLLANDPGQRLQAIVPQVTWNNLAFSLSPGGVPKSGYGAALGAVVPLKSKTGFEPYISTMLGRGLVDNKLPQSDLNELTYHSLKYTCDGSTFGRQPARLLPKVDALLMQGMDDVLFNINEGYENFKCLTKAGGDVRFMTYHIGHAWPPAIAGGGVGGKGSKPDACGERSSQMVEIAWLQAKLMDKPELVADVPTMCISLDGEGDSITPAALPVGGVAASIKPTLVTPSVLGALPIAYPLYTADVEADRVLAGIPQAVVNVEGLGGPVAAVGDPILFFGLGRAGATGLIEPIGSQVRPIRGWGKHSFDLNAVGWRMHKGETLYLLVYGVHPQFLADSSRVAAPKAVISGVLGLPLQGLTGSVSSAPLAAVPLGALAPVPAPVFQILPEPIANAVNKVEAGIFNAASSAFVATADPVVKVVAPLVFNTADKAVTFLKGVLGLTK